MSGLGQGSSLLFHVMSAGAAQWGWGTHFNAGWLLRPWVDTAGQFLSLWVSPWEAWAFLQSSSYIVRAKAPRELRGSSSTCDAKPGNCKALLSLQPQIHLDSRGGASTPPLYGRRSGSHCIECNRRHCALILRMYSCLHTNTHTESTSTLSLWSSHCTINSGNFMALTLTKRHCHSPLLV